MTSWCLLDIETIATPDADRWVERPTVDDAPGNYKNPDAIARWCEETYAKRLSAAGKDIDLAVALCIGVQIESGPHLCQSWTADGTYSSTVEPFALSVALNYLCRDVIVGFGIARFDLPILYRRALLLNVPDLPRLELRYREMALVWPSGMRSRIIDLEDEFTWQGRLRDTLKPLAWYYERYGGPPLDDPHTGADVPRLYAAGELGAIASHCLADLARLRYLAERLGVIEAEAFAAETLADA